LSPGLSIRIEIEMFTGAAGVAGVTGGAADGSTVAGAGGVGAATDAAGVAGTGGAASACAGTAKNAAESAETALPARAMRLQEPITVRMRTLLSPELLRMEIPIRQYEYVNVEKLLTCFRSSGHYRLVRVTSDPAFDLVLDHLSLVRTLASRYARRGESFEDLVQVAAVGLVAAARRFDPGRGVPFAAYALPTIDGELRRHLRDRSSTVRVPRREQELAGILRREAERTAQRRRREATLAETAAAAGVSLSRAAAALGAVAEPLPLAELERRPSAEAEDELEACERRALVADLLATLPPREREIVRLRFAEELQQAEIAHRLHISQSQTSRLLAGALEKLRGAYDAAA
jgi:RNA polymerase sigma-B factor